MIGDRNIELQVDGGINIDTAKTVIEAGASILVAGSAIFNKPDYEKAINELRSSAN
jgi:ribulose-phosphate 3-epimerase